MDHQVVQTPVKGSHLFLKAQLPIQQHIHEDIAQIMIDSHLVGTRLAHETDIACPTVRTDT